MSGRADPAAMLREHTAPAGAPIVPTRGPLDWRDRWNDRNCRGELRAMYVREAGAPPPRDPSKWRQDKPKLTWRRVGYVCLRCGVVELHADVLPLDKLGEYHYNKSDRARRPGAVLVPGTLAAAPTTETTECPDCTERVTRSNLARHRRRRHSPAVPPGVIPGAAESLTGWAPGEFTEVFGR